MTYEQVADVFSRFPEASIWPDRENPLKFFFIRSAGNERSVHLTRDDGQASFLWVAFDEVRDHVEPTGRRDSQNIYYRLRRAA
jgi:hypothetical protein